jgi:AcrR family transcriptional regulator
VPPYLRIATELRRRIAAGELRPGDRLPSTRALAAEWGVALATAGRAVAELRRAGVVRTQARAGTVVAAPPAPRRRRPPAAPARRAPAPTGELSRQSVVRTAIALADGEGLEALSMRAVAAHLGVSPMGLYRHVRGKDELVLLMADAAYGEIGRNPAPVGAWRAVLEWGARALWRTYRHHPWLAHVGPLARPLPLPNLLRYGEPVLAALSGTGLPAARVLDLHILLYSYSQGLAANHEREARARADTGLSDEQWIDTQEPALTAVARDGDHPHFAALMADLDGGYDFDLQALFETGLHSLLDGFAQLIAREAGRT